MNTKNLMNVRKIVLLPSEIEMLRKIADGKYVKADSTADELFRLELVEKDFRFDNYDRIYFYRITLNGKRYLHWLDTYQADQIKTDKRARLSLFLSVIAIGLSTVGLLHQLISK